MKHLVITVHGIRTFGGWQKRLKSLLEKREPKIDVRHYGYGYFSVLAFLVPPIRWLETRRFRADLQRTSNEPWDRIDIVAHSFGTDLVGWGLYRMKADERPKIHTIVLAGSVLSRRFPWLDLIGHGIERVVNECGTQDSILVLSQCFVLRTSFAGRLGFKGMEHERFLNRYFKLGHSGYFEAGASSSPDQFMMDHWIPLLTGEQRAVPVDQRPPLSPIGRIIAFLLNNFTPIKISLWLALFGVIVWWAAALHRQQRLTESHKLAGLSLPAQSQDPQLALRLAAEAFSRSDNVQSRSALLAAVQNVRWIKVFLSSDLRHVSDLAFSADGSLLAAANDEGGRKLAVWETSPPRLRRFHDEEPPFKPGEIRVVGSGFTRARFDPGDRFVVAVSWDGNNSVAIPSGDASAKVVPIPPPMRAVNPRDQRFAVLSDDKYILYQDDRTPLRRHLLREGKAIGDLFFAHDGKTLVAQADDRVLMWNVTQFRRLKSEDDEVMPNLQPIELVTGAKINRLDVGATEGRMAVLIGNTVQVWDTVQRVKTNELALGYASLLRDVALWPGKPLVVSAGGGGSTGEASLRVWHTQTGDPEGTLLVSFDRATTAVEFSGDGRRLASGDNKGKVILWEFPDGPFLGKVLTWGDRKASVIAVSPTERVVAAGFPGGEVTLQNLDRGEAPKEARIGTGAAVTAVAFDRRGRNVFVADTLGTVSVLDVSSWALTRSKAVFTSAIRELKMDPSGDRLAATGDTPDIQVLDSSTLDVLAKFTHEKDFGVPSIAFHPNAPYLFSRGVNYLHIWNLREKQEEGKGLWGANGTGPWAFQPRGEQMASAADLTLEILRMKKIFSALRDHTPVLPRGAQFKGHKESVTAIAYSPDGKFLAGCALRFESRGTGAQAIEDALSPGDKYEIILWSVEGGVTIGQPLVASEGPALSLNFTPDGKGLISLHTSGRAILWDIDPTSWEAQALRVAGGSLPPPEVEAHLKE